MQFGLSIYGAWWFSLIYLIFAYGLWFIFPKFVQIRFTKTPYINYISEIYKYSYILLLLLTIFIPFQINTYFFIGLGIYLLGLFIYISAIFYFSINEIDLPVTKGIYKYLRHPVYFGFIIMYLGITLISSNILLLILSLVIAYCSYQIALLEEELCSDTYGKDYINYKKTSGFFKA